MNLGRGNSLAIFFSGEDGCFQIKMVDFQGLPSGNWLHSYGSHGPFSSLIYLVKMVIFHSYVSLPEGIHLGYKKPMKAYVPRSKCDGIKIEYGRHPTIMKGVSNKRFQEELV